MQSLLFLSTPSEIVFNKKKYYSKTLTVLPQAEAKKNADTIRVLPLASARGRTVDFNVVFPIQMWQDAIVRLFGSTGHHHVTVRSYISPQTAKKTTSRQNHVLCDNQYGSNA